MYHLYRRRPHPLYLFFLLLLKGRKITTLSLFFLLYFKYFSLYYYLKFEISLKTYAVCVCEYVTGGM